MSVTAVLPPIWTNASLTAWYYRQLDELLQASEALPSFGDLLWYIAQAWQEQPPTIGLASDAAVPNIERALNAWGRKWTARVTKASRRIAAAFAARSQQATEYSMLQYLKQAGFTVSFRPTRKSIEAYRAVAAENVGLIKSIATKYHDDVREQVWNAVRVGYDLSALSQKLRKSYGISVRRAALISRDQASKARAIIEATRRQELGITEGVWRHSHAGREPRPTHVRMDGHRYLLAKGMWDPAENEFVHPGQLINCRCSSSAIIPGIHT